MVGAAMDSSPSRLTALQRAVLAEFFARERGFFLTGGGALAGYHLCHRETLDLDLFTTDATAYERSAFVLADVARTLGATLVVRQEAPGFRRSVLERPSDGVVIDTVLDPVAQVEPDKLDVEGVRIDPIREIMANKLCAVIGRAEERDLVDLWTLEQRGVSIESGLDDALTKDGGCTPANLAWLLGQVTLADDARLSGSVSPSELRRWLADAVARLRRRALPDFTR